MSESPIRKCPDCGKLKLRRLFGTGAAVMFKGSGFYETDYRSESYKAGEKKEKEAAKPSDSSEKPKKSEKSSDGAKSADSSGGEKKGGKKKDPA